MKRAVIYARYSSNRQTDASIQAQVRACEEYAAQNEMEILQIYKDEAISGKGSSTNKRAEYQKMLKDSKRNMFDVILVHKYDRIARDVSEHFSLAAKLESVNIELIAVTQTVGDGKEALLIKTLFFALSQYYSDNLSEEVKKGHKENALKALHNGGVPPFGYDVEDRHFVINELEASFVRRMFQCAVEEVGYTDLLEEMAATGIRGKRGAIIKYPQVHEILHNEKYSGVYLYSPEEEKKRSDRRTKTNAIRIENAFPAIIDKETFALVQEKMKKRERTGKAAKHEYLCSGKVYCRCGAPMHASTTKRKGHEYPIYSCSARCGIGVLSVEVIDKAATEYLSALLTPGNVSELANALLQYKATRKNRISEFERERKARIAEKQQQYDNLMANISSGVLPSDILADIGQKMEILKSELIELKNLTLPEDNTPQVISEWLNSLKEASDKSAIRNFIERIEVRKIPVDDNSEAKKTKPEISIVSTLIPDLGKDGCGGRI